MKAPRLTRRQFDVAIRLARGLTTKEIAAELGIATQTVDSHRWAACIRLQVNGIAQLTRKMIEWENFYKEGT